MVGFCGLHTQQSMLITEKAFDLGLVDHHAQEPAIELSRCPDLWLIKNRFCLSRDSTMTFCHLPGFS